MLVMKRDIAETNPGVDWNCGDCVLKRCNVRTLGLLDLLIYD
jgi:hypothetical protein